MTESGQRKMRWPNMSGSSMSLDPDLVQLPWQIDAEKLCLQLSQILASD